MLLDNFITASSQMEKEEQEHQTEDLLRESVSRCSTLTALAASIATNSALPYASWSLLCTFFCFVFIVCVCVCVRTYVRASGPAACLFCVFVFVFPEVVSCACVCET